MTYKCRYCEHLKQMGDEGAMACEYGLIVGRENFCKQFELATEIRDLRREKIEDNRLTEVVYVECEECGRISNDLTDWEYVFTDEGWYYLCPSCQKEEK